MWPAAMMPVADAQATILAQVARPTAPEALPVPQALGRTLAGDVQAPFDVPPATNSAVDGYAVRFTDLAAGGTSRLRVVRDLLAGAVSEHAVGPGEAIRIMTGAPLPAGADTVVPQELAETEPGHVRLAAVPHGVNVRARGEDVRAGAIVLARGAVLRPQELGLLASLGLREVWVHARPRVAILSTGDEVAEPGKPRRRGQIYDANRFALHGLVTTAGGAPLDLGIVPDLREALRARLSEAAGAADVVLTSGGVSVGVHDLVKEVLGELGGVAFWQVAMQPGRPLAFGRIGESHFFGLPGNPVASMLCFLLFVRPALWKLGGRRDLAPVRFTARALEPMSKRVGRQEFKRGVLRHGAAGWEVATTGPQGSGILSSMVIANCLIVLDEPRGDVAAGESVVVEPLEGLSWTT
jgi:molybdopterin molybdotransferase